MPDDDPSAATEDPNLDDDAPADPSSAKTSNPPRPNYAPLYHSFHSQFKYVRPGAGPIPVTSSARPLTQCSLWVVLVLVEVAVILGRLCIRDLLLHIGAPTPIPVDWTPLFPPTIEKSF